MAGYLRSAPPPFTESALTAVRCPVLVVLGDRDFSGPADRLVAALPNATLLTLRKTDHFATASDFTCMEEVSRFLGEQDRPDTA